MSSLVVCGIEETSRNSRSKNKSIGDLEPQYGVNCTEECLKVKQSWKNHLIKLESEEDLLKNELMKIESDDKTLVSSSSGKIKECKNIHESNTKVFKENTNSTEDYSEKSMPVGKNNKVGGDAIS